jgi:RNA polymerase sigma-70 factor (ECF subfamily)
MGPMITKELLDKCVSRDPKAWEKFIRASTPFVKRAVRYKLKRMSIHLSRAPEDDIVQEIFLRLWKNDRLAGIRDVSSLEAWISIVSMNITHNYCAKHLFQDNDFHLSLDGSRREGPDMVRLHRIIEDDRAEDPLAPLKAEDLRRIVDRAMRPLNFRHKLVLKLILSDHRSHRDVSRIMNLPKSAADTLIRRAKLSLRKEIEKIVNADPGKYCL